MELEIVSNKVLVDWVRLIRSTNIGEVTFNALLQVYKTPKKALEMLPELIKNAGPSKKSIKICSKAEAEAEIEKVENLGGYLLASIDKRYPALLRHIKDFPPILTAYGELHLLQSVNLIAIVGSRNSSMHGRKFAYKLASDLTERGFVIVSGLALGIDTAAHNIIYNGGSTIAVMANGINFVYPSANKGLYEAIVEKGLVITEAPFDAQPKPQSFPRRNRIISGISQGVVVVEANKTSGSLITAEFALMQGREVFAVPGSPLDARYSGTNQLIKEGAMLVENANDIIEALHFRDTPLKFSALQDSREKYFGMEEAINSREVQSIKGEILKLLSIVPLDIDELISELTVKPQIVLVALLELELIDKIERHPGNKVSLMVELIS